MQIIKLGSKGSDVERWQNFLMGFYPDVRGHLDADANFGPITHAVTIRFQRQMKLTADGVVGNKTVGLAMSKGFPVVDSAEDDDEGPSWPPAPAGMSYLSDAARTEMFGSFKYAAAPTETNPEAIRILDGWERDNILTVTVPQFSKIAGAPKSGSCRINKHCSKQFLDLWAAWEKAGLLDRVLLWNGSFAPRFIRGSEKNLSNHAYGSAFDINAKYNQLGAQPALKGKTGSVRELVTLAYSHGFSWGGWYKNRPDGMHFECYKVL